MSHWTKIQTKIRDLEILKKALERMGLKFNVGDHKITQYGTTEKAEIKLDDAVGLSVQKDGTYAMVGDFWHSHNKNLRKYYGKANQFSADLQTSYAIEEASTRLEEQQFFCTENSEAEIGEDGLITMTFTCYE